MVKCQQIKENTNLNHLKWFYQTTCNNTANAQFQLLLHQWAEHYENKV